MRRKYHNDVKIRGVFHENRIAMPENVPRESMLTYAVLCGQQARRNDPYALGALLTDMGVRGHLCIVEPASNEAGLLLPATPDADLLEEEIEFVTLLQRDCAPDDTGYISLVAPGRENWLLN